MSMKLDETFDQGELLIQFFIIFLLFSCAGNEKEPYYYGK